MYLVSWLVLGAVAGLITREILRGNQYGPVMGVMMGIAGAVAAGLLLVYAELPGPLEVFSTTLSAIFGAVALTALNGRTCYALIRSSY